MKKKFLTYLIFAILLPCILLFNACSPSKEEENLQVRINNNFVQLSYDGKTWTNLISVDDIKDAVITDDIYVTGIEKTGTNNNVDTYTIYFSNDTTSTFEITNGTNGINGTNGAVWLTGENSPTNDIGNKGDLYLDTSTNNVYQKGDDSWSNVCNIKGEKGISIKSITLAETRDNVDYYRIELTEGEAINFSIMNGYDASYATYTVSYNYGDAQNLFNETKECDTIKSTEWITSLPTIKEEYQDAFLGWFTLDTDKKIDKYDFIGGNITLCPKFNPASASAVSGLYQNGKYVKSWETIKQENPTAFESSGKIFTTLSLEGDLIIDNEITILGNRAFNDCNNLTSVRLPNQLTGIGQFAFQNCSNLQSIVIPNTVKTIWYSAFNGCTKLKDLTFEKDSTLQVIYHSAFYNCTSLTNIIIPKTVSTINAEAFRCAGLENLIFEDDSALEYIGENTFCDCTNLKSLIIPKGVTTLGENFICNCKSLETLAVESGNTKYKSKSNCILSKDGLTLYFGCKTSIIPNGVQTINALAFNGCSTLTSIVIPSSVTNVDQNGEFDNCIKLETVFIDNSAFASNLHQDIDCGCITKYAKNIYIKTGLSVSESYYWDEYFTKQTTSDEDGYDWWIKNS